VRNCQTGITSPITAVTLTKYKDSCDNSVTCTAYLTAKVAYEKEFHFFTAFTIPTGCGPLTYTLEDGGTNAVINPSVASVDDIALVPGKKRLFIKSAATAGTKTYKVVATNPQSIVVKATDLITVTLNAMVKMDYYQEYIDLWK